jgi:hypothetical protein
MDELHIAESANEYGISKDMRIEDGNLITRHTYDAQPMLEAAAQARTMSEGRRWGDGQFVGIIPFAELTRINETHSGAEARKHAILTWLRDNPKLVTFDKFLKR